MRHNATRTIFYPAAANKSKLSAAIVRQKIQRAITKQAVKVIALAAIVVARIIFTFAIAKKFVTVFVLVFILAFVFILVCHTPA